MWLISAGLVSQGFSWNHARLPVWQKLNPRLNPGFKRGDIDWIDVVNSGKSSIYHALTYSVYCEKTKQSQYYVVHTCHGNTDWS